MNRVGPYEIVGELGAGGMGVVYRARREGDHPDVALKVIAGGGDASPEALARFQREARIAQELDHPGIVKVLETGQDGETVYFAMELVEGEPLSQQIREREFTWQEAVTIVRDVAGALAVAHDKGVLHRDLKPGNIIMDAEGKPHLTDFGLAKDTRTESKHTRTGQAIGTPAYMSPEQARGDLADLAPASDVWALGCVLYELMHNRVAFEGETAAAVIGAVLSTAPACGTLPKPVRTLVLSALQRDPRRRYPDARAFRDDCDRALAGGAPTGMGGGSRATRLVVAAVLTAPIALAAGWWSVGHDAPVAPPDARVSAAREARARADRLADRAWAFRFVDLPAAIGFLHQALEIEPGHPTATLHLGGFLWSTGEREAGIERWRSLPANSPQYARAQWLAGLAIYAEVSKGTGTEAGPAREAWGRAAAGPEPVATWARAGLALANSEPARAREMMPADGDWSAALLRGLIEMGGGPQGARVDFDVVRKAYAYVIEHGPPIAYVYDALAVALDQLGDHAGGLVSVEQALKLNPNYFLARLNRATLLEHCQRTPEALRAYDHAIALRPTFAGAWVGRAGVCRQLGDLPEALRNLGEAIRLDPSNGRALAERGALHVQLGNYPDARGDLNRAVELQPREAQTVFNRGLVRLIEGDRDGATADFERTVALDSHYAIAWTNLAELYFHAGDRRAAMAAADRSVACNPDDDRSLARRALLRRATGDLQGARDDLDHAIEIEPRNALARFTRFEMRYETEPVEALADARVAAEVAPHKNRHQRALVLGYMVNGRWAEAIAAIEQATQRPMDADTTDWMKANLTHCTIRLREAGK